MVWAGLTGSGTLLGPHFIEGGMDTREYLRIIRYNVVQRDRHNIDRHIIFEVERNYIHCTILRQSCILFIDSPGI